MLADKAYDADQIRILINEQALRPTCRSKGNRRWKPCFGGRLYRGRSLIERFFSKLKHFHRVATRYDKLAANFSPWSSSPRCSYGSGHMVYGLKLYQAVLRFA